MSKSIASYLCNEWKWVVARRLALAARPDFTLGLGCLAALDFDRRNPTSQRPTPTPEPQS